ncbi:hypothetical protein BCF44_103614 [Kutzneria buriramensis]|uniref:wHTH-Hsp90 Na associated domain-containing protein n=2 Tax=Kutzneria buriramensis TaxID=1045776 RepID=A0A3E0I0E4_9PSEU|nr:hypothetical protein BCF44_103614 [Kutzneria buriramensis]
MGVGLDKFVTYTGEIKFADRIDNLLLEDIDDTNKPIALGHLHYIAQELDLDIDEVTQYVVNVGLTPPNVRRELSTDDLELISVDLDGRGPWLDTRLPVQPHHLIKAYADLYLPPEQVVARLTSLGFRMAFAELPDLTGFPDLTLLRQASTGLYLDPDKPVTLAHLVHASRRRSEPITDVAERLQKLGMKVPDLATTVRNAMARVPREN